VSSLGGRELLADLAMVMALAIDQDPKSICPYAYRMAKLLDEHHEKHFEDELWTDFLGRNLRLDKNGEAMVGFIAGFLLLNQHAINAVRRLRNGHRD